jgi:hypothetical protein
MGLARKYIKETCPVIVTLTESGSKGRLIYRLEPLMQQEVAVTNT